MALALTLTASPKVVNNGDLVTLMYAVTGEPTPQTINEVGTAVTADGLALPTTEAIYIGNSEQFNAPTAPGVTFAGTADPKVWTARFTADAMVGGSAAIDGQALSTSVQITLVVPPPPPPPPPVVPPTPTGTKTLFGAAVAMPFSSSLALSDSRMGPLGMVRVYDSSAGAAATIPQCQAAGLGKRPICVSFKADHFGGPVGVVSGLMDADINSLLAVLPTNVVTYVAYGHEPELKVKGAQYTIEQWIAAFQHVAALIKAHGNPMVRSTMILTGWDYANRLPQYYPGDAAVDVLGVDPYSSTPGDTAQGLLSQYVTIAAQHKKPIAVCEIGCKYSDPAQVAAFVQSLAWCKGKFEFISWFNTQDYGASKINYVIDGIAPAAAAFQALTR
jgi:hypothetical protein